MTKGEYIKYAIQKTVSEYSFLEWLEMWDIDEKDWDKFMSEGSKAVSQEESGEEQEPCGKDINVRATDGKKDVLDKVKTEIEKQDEWLAQAGYNAYNVDIAFNSIKRVISESEE